MLKFSLFRHSPRSKEKKILKLCEISLTLKKICCRSIRMKSFIASHTHDKPKELILNRKFSLRR